MELFIAGTKFQNMSRMGGVQGVSSMLWTNELKLCCVTITILVL